MKKNPTLWVVAAALAGRDGRVLLQQRAPGRDMEGLWEFPGGKVEAEETPEAALVRELREELGILVDPRSLTPGGFASAANGDRHMILLLYLCRTWEGEARALDAASLRWTEPAEMPRLPMPPADQPLIGQLEALLRASA